MRHPSTADSSNNGKDKPEKRQSVKREEEYR